MQELQSSWDSSMEKMLSHRCPFGNRTSDASSQYQISFAHPLHAHVHEVIHLVFAVVVAAAD